MSDRKGALAQHFEAYVSALVVEEAGRGDNVQAKLRLDAIASFPVLDIDPEAEKLAERIVASGGIPDKCPEDALHIAIAAVNGVERIQELMGWSCARRCIFLRRPAQRGLVCKALPVPTKPEFDFVEYLDSGPSYEYIVLVTNDHLPIVAMAQLYRDRADCENVFDEIKNQWGWAGFVTRDLHRCCINFSMSKTRPFMPSSRRCCGR